MRHFEKLSKEEVTKLAKIAGSKKNPKKGTGSLPKEERVRRAREAANKRWRNDERTGKDETESGVNSSDETDT